MTKKAATFSLDEEVIDALDNELSSLPIGKSNYVNIVLGGTLGLWNTQEALVKLCSSAGLGDELTKAVQAAVIEELQNKVAEK